VVSVPEQVLALTGERRNSMEAAATFTAAPDVEYSLTLKEISTEADARTQTFAVTFTMPQPEEVLIFAGMTAQVWVRPTAGVAVEDVGETFIVPVTAVYADDREATHVWVYDMETGTRLTVAARGFIPVWSPDGASVIYGDLDESGIVVRDADGSGEDERILFDEDIPSNPTSWSPDGQWIATDLMDLTPEGSVDIHMLSPSGDSRAFLETPANEFSAMFSPDGRWVAYQSDQSGRNEVYVEPFPGPGERIAVSARGGTSPVWSSDGTELYFWQDTAVIAVTVDTTDGFSVSPPRYVVDGQYWLDPTAHVTFGVFPDGKLLMIDTGQANEIHVVLNWVDELKRLVPTDN
jgi:Tol biopolymer transport system component